MGFKLGEEHFRTKLTVDDVRSIRQLAQGMTIRKIAEQFKVSHHCVHLITTHKTWKHVGE